MFYTPERLRRIKNAVDYKELLAVAMEVLYLTCLEDPVKPIAMVCGPISKTGGVGSRKRNLEIFSKAIDRLRAEKLAIFSQMPFEDDMERLFKSDPKLQGIELLEEFYLPIFKTKIIKILFFLPGWETSFGAVWEHRQAEILGIPRVYLANFYLYL